MLLKRNWVMESTTNELFNWLLIHNKISPEKKGICWIRLISLWHKTECVLPVHPAVSNQHSRLGCCHVWPLGWSVIAQSHCPKSPHHNLRRRPMERKMGSGKKKDEADAQRKLHVGLLEQHSIHVPKPVSPHQKNHHKTALKNKQMRLEFYYLFLWFSEGELHMSCDSLWIVSTSQEERKLRNRSPIFPSSE